MLQNCSRCLVLLNKAKLEAKNMSGAAAAAAVAAVVVRAENVTRDGNKTRCRSLMSARNYSGLSHTPQKEIVSLLDICDKK